MDMARILIVALGASCLIVIALIVVVLRRPAPTKPIRKGAADEQTLARVFAVQPTPPAPPPPPTPLRPTPDVPMLAAPHFPEEQAPLGRMPGLPPLPPDPRPPVRPVPGARIPPEPLPFERLPSSAGWESSSIMPVVRPNASDLAPPSPSAGSGPLSFAALAAPAGYLDAPSGGRRSDTSLGRMPGFAPADQPLSMVSSPLPNLNGERRLGALTRLYAENIQVSYDSSVDAVEVTFSDCPLRSPAEIEQAFRVLLAKVHTALKPTSRDRAALLMDIGGLELSANLALVWGSSLKSFLAAACEPIGPERYLIARYNARASSNGNRQSAVERIQTSTPSGAQELQNAIFTSRDEAVALLARLRELATMPGF